MGHTILGVQLSLTVDAFTRVLFANNNHWVKIRYPAGL